SSPATCNWTTVTNCSGWACGRCWGNPSTRCNWRTSCAKSGRAGMSEHSLTELQRQLQLQNEQFAERLRSELPVLAELASELQQTRAPESRRLLVVKIRERLHKLAGAAGTFGFARLGERARV